MFVCPMCGSVVEASATECQNCGEPFAPIEDEVVQEDYVEETEPLAPEEEYSGEEPFEDYPENWREEWIITTHRDMTPEELLKQRPDVIMEVSSYDCGEVLDAFNIKTVEDFAKLKYFVWAQELVALKNNPSLFRKEDFDNKLTEVYKEKEFDEILQAPTFALLGLSEYNANNLSKAFNVNSIEELGSLESITWAQKIFEMAHPSAEILQEDEPGDTDFDEDTELPEDMEEEGEYEVTEEMEEETEEIDAEAPEPEISTAGCPICGSKQFTVETGDLVSCDECGNVYIKKEELLPPEHNWKLKFWVGLIFIILGDIGVALGSYVHNVYRWSPLGDLYLGYGWLDQAVGIVGVVIFILGLILFAWSFKRDRTVTCPSCKVVIREVELLPFEEEEEEEGEPEPEDIETAVEEIGEIGECPHCGAQVSVYDTICPNCESPIENDVETTVTEEEIYEEIPPEETEIEGEPEVETEPEAEAEPQEPADASELNETEIIMESLEYLEEEVQADEQEVAVENNGGLQALRELEEEFGATDEEITCAECGMLIEGDSTVCPICGADVAGGE